MAVKVLLTAIVALISFTRRLNGQNCYYPDGSLSTEGDGPCTSQGGACCPLNWMCMSNGLCYLDSENYYGRYTCTDQTWQSPDCPQLCTQDNTAAGNEAILWCPNGDWCCDGNRVSFNCCTKADAVSFSLPDPQPIKFISSLPSPTPASSVTNKPPSTSNGITVSSSSASSTSLTESARESTTTDSNGSPSTLTQVVTVGPAAVAPSETGTSEKHPHHSPNLAMIVGIAVGIPLVLVVAGILLWLLFKHMRDSRQHHRDSSANLKDIYDPCPEIIPANNQPTPEKAHTHEIFGSPVAKTDRRSEMSGSDVSFMSPNPSVPSPRSPPSAYSLGTRIEPIGEFSGRREIAELPAGEPEPRGLGVQQPKPENPSGYKPYRPPGHENVNMS